MAEDVETSTLQSMAATPEVRALEENLWSMWSLFGRGRGCRLIDTPDVLLYETPIAQPPYNAVFRFRGEGDGVEERIDALLARFHERSVPVMWVVHPSAAPADLRARLGSRGLAPVDSATGMTRTLDDLPGIPPSEPGIEVREGTLDDVAEWMGLVSWRYDLPASTAGTLESIYRLALGGPEAAGRTRWWAARRADTVVSKAVLHVADGIAGVYGVATREEGRGLGLATRLTLTALHAAREQGCRLAVLHSTPMAVGLYERLGFRSAATFELWAEPGGFHL